MADVTRLPGKPYRADLARFLLYRTEDVSGISGTGVVAEGIRFSDGTVVLRWVTGDHRSTVVWPDIESVKAIHGHGGATSIQFIDP
jgi:hypothetical protein